MHCTSLFHVDYFFFFRFCYHHPLVLSSVSRRYMVLIPGQLQCLWHARKTLYTQSILYVLGLS